MTPPEYSVVHFNSFADGGAATAARKIHDSLVTSGVDSRFLYTEGDVDEPTYLKLRSEPHAGLIARLQRGFIHRFRQRIGAPRPGYSEPFGWPTNPGLTMDAIPSVPSSIIHLHWIVGLLDYKVFFRQIPRETPIVWTLHDMNPFTGGCHYAWDCTGFVNRCTPCPQLAKIAHLVSARTCQRVKQKNVAGRNLHIVADSHWLEQEARKSWILRSARSFRTIHYGVDLQTFRPRDLVAARRRLGVGDSAIVIAFGADRLDNRRKGFRELCAALSRLEKKDDFELLTFGERSDSPGPNGIRWQHLGTLRSREKLSMLYSAADIFVMASLQEAFGQTAQEALACATPVVSFDVGGISDTVRPNETGLLAGVGDVQHLARNISSLALNPDERERLGRNGRRLMEREFSLENQKQAYLELYCEIADDQTK